jgi:hypothetical protein
METHYTIKHFFLAEINKYSSQTALKRKYGSRMSHYAQSKFIFSSEYSLLPKSIIKIRTKIIYILVINRLNNPQTTLKRKYKTNVT